VASGAIANVGLLNFTKEDAYPKSAETLYLSKSPSAIDGRL
jgi:hypothetical protein